VNLLLSDVIFTPNIPAECPYSLISLIEPSFSKSRDFSKGPSLPFQSNIEIFAFFHQFLEYLSGFFIAAFASSLETKILVSGKRSATPLTFSKSR